MANESIPMERKKRIALIAHDNRKRDLLEWARYNRGTLSRHQLYATGTTGTQVGAELDLPVTLFLSGPLGGDQQVGAGVAEGRIDFVIFFWDPLEPQPHDVDVKALLRIAVVYNVPIACNRASADFMLSSPLMDTEYERMVPNRNRISRRSGASPTDAPRRPRAVRRGEPHQVEPRRQRRTRVVSAVPVHARGRIAGQPSNAPARDVIHVERCRPLTRRCALQRDRHVRPVRVGRNAQHGAGVQRW